MRQKKPKAKKIEWTEGKSIPGNPEFNAVRGQHRLSVWLQTGPGGRWWGGFSWIGRGAWWCEVTTRAKTAAEAKKLVIAKSLAVEAEEAP